MADDAKRNMRARIWPVFALLAALFFGFATWDSVSRDVVRFRSRGLPPIKKQDDPQAFRFNVLFSASMSVLILSMCGWEWSKRKKEMPNPKRLVSPS